MTFYLSVVVVMIGPEASSVVVVRRARGGDGGDEDVGECGRWTRLRGMRRARDPVGSQTADERGIGNRNVRRAERRAAVDGGDWKL